MTQGSHQRQVPVTVEDVADAMDLSDDMVTYYLDVETGDIVPVSEDSSYELERMYDRSLEDGGDDSGEAVAREIARAEDIPDWQRKVLLEALRVREDRDSRYVAIPAVESRDGYRDMEAFISTLESDSMQGRLLSAIRGRRPFRHFKDALYDYPEEGKRWSRFQAARIRERAVQWLEEEGIEPLPGQDEAGG